MKIIIKTQGMPKQITIRIPNFILSDRVLKRYLKPYIEFEGDAELSKLVRNCLRQMHEQHPGLPLVQVESADGDGICILP